MFFLDWKFLFCFFFNLTKIWVDIMCLCFALILKWLWLLKMFSLPLVVSKGVFVLELLPFYFSRSCFLTWLFDCNRQLEVTLLLCKSWHQSLKWQGSEMEDHVQPIGLGFITIRECFFYCYLRGMRASECSEKTLVKTSERNTKSQMISSRVVWCV